MWGQVWEYPGWCAQSHPGPRAELSPMRQKGSGAAQDGADPCRLPRPREPALTVQGQEVAARVHARPAARRRAQAGLTRAGAARVPPGPSAARCGDPTALRREEAGVGLGRRPAPWSRAPAPRALQPASLPAPPGDWEGGRARGLQHWPALAGASGCAQARNSQIPLAFSATASHRSQALSLLRAAGPRPCLGVSPSAGVMLERIPPRPKEKIAKGLTPSRVAA